MGMYTELQLNCELDSIDYGILFALGEHDKNVGFENVWCGMLQGCSAYFPYNGRSEYEVDRWGHTYINIRCNIKNYKNQLEEFLSYLHQAIKAFDGDFLGFIRYEEDQLPILLIYRDDKIEYKEIKA